MSILRSMLVALIALAIAVAPIGSALAGFSAGANKAVTLGDRAPDSAIAPDAQVMDMADCDKAMHGSRTDCPCCDAKGVCPPDLCPLKGHKVFGASGEPVFQRPAAPTLIRPAKTDQPPDWRAAPQPPPPRA